MYVFRRSYLEYVKVRSSELKILSLTLIFKKKMKNPNERLRVI